MFKKKYTKNLDNLKNVKKSEFGIYLAASKKKFKKKYKNILTHKQGKKLIDEEELIIMRVYLNFKLKNNNFRKNITKLNSDVAYMCEISEVTLHRIKVKFDIDVQVNYQLLSKKEKKT